MPSLIRALKYRGTNVLKRLKNLGQSIRREIRVYQLVLRDPRTPRLPKLLLGLAVGYALMPFDLIPDFIPILGHLDDVIIIPGLVWLALKMIPADVLNDCKKKAQAL